MGGKDCRRQHPRIVARRCRKCGHSEEGFLLCLIFMKTPFQGSPWGSWPSAHTGSERGPRPVRRRKKSLPCVRGGGSSQTGVGRVVTGSFFDHIFYVEGDAGYNPPVSKLTAPFAQGGLGGALLQVLTLVPSVYPPEFIYCSRKVTNLVKTSGGGYGIV